MASQPLHDIEAFREASEQILDQAKQEILIFSRDLDAPIYDQLDWLDALKHVLLRQRKVKLRILVMDSNHAVKYGHRLIEMAQRLNSFIEIRVPRFEEETFAGAFLITDERGLIWRPNGSLYQGEFDPGGSRRIRELRALFIELWEKATPDPNLRRLHI